MKVIISVRFHIYLQFFFFTIRINYLFTVGISHIICSYKHTEHITKTDFCNIHVSKSLYNHPGHHIIFLVILKNRNYMFMYVLGVHTVSHTAH